MSSLTAASKPSTKYSLQLIGRKLPAPSRLRRSLDSSISSPGNNGAAPAAATRRNASLSSSSTSSAAAAAASDKFNSASTKAAAWVWHQRGVGEPVAPTKRVQRPGSSSSESSSPSHLPKSRFFAESIKARAAVMPPTALFDAFELSSLRFQMAELVGRLHEDAPAAEEHHEGEERLQEHEGAGAEAADLHVNKPMEAELQASTKGGAGPKVRHASLDEDAYYSEAERPARIGGSFRSGVSAGAGANQKSHSSSSSSSLAKPFSAIHKLFQKISKAVKSPSSRRGDTSQYANVHEGLDQHYHYHHYHHHHYHHYNYEEEGCGPDEAFAMARRRRFSDSAGVVVYGGEARGQPGQAADQGQTSPMTTWGLPAAASSELEAGSPAGCAVPPPSGAAGEPALRSTKSGHGVSIHSSRLRLPQRKSVKPTSLQLGSQKAAEMATSAPSATRLRRLSDSLSDRQAALLQLDLARSMKTSCNNNNYSNQAAAAGAAPSRRRHSGTFSAVKAY